MAVFGWCNDRKHDHCRRQRVVLSGDNKGKTAYCTCQHPGCLCSKQEIPADAA